MGLGPNSHVTGEGATGLGRRWPLCLPRVVANWRGRSAGALAPLLPTLPASQGHWYWWLLSQVFYLHWKCEFSCCVLASEVPPSLFPPASSVARFLSLFLPYVQPWQGLLDLKQHLTLLVFICLKQSYKIFLLLVGYFATNVSKITCHRKLMYLVDSCTFKAFHYFFYQPVCQERFLL